MSKKYRPTRLEVDINGEAGLETLRYPRPGYELDYFQECDNYIKVVECIKDDPEEYPQKHRNFRDYRTYGK